MKPVIISFYTPEWKYPYYAEKLKSDSDRLNIPYHIIEKPSQKDYVANCNMKPKFILDSILELKQPVIWMDVDGTINNFPSELLSDEMLDYDIAGFQSIRDQTRIHVATLWFNYNPRVIELLTTWYESSIRFLDDGAFQTTLRQYENSVKIKVLSKKYFTILSNPTDLTPEDSFFVHRLSSSELKWEYKNKVENR